MSGPSERGDRPRVRPRARPSSTSTRSPRLRHPEVERRLAAVRRARQGIGLVRRDRQALSGRRRAGRRSAGSSAARTAGSSPARTPSSASRAPATRGGASGSWPTPTASVYHCVDLIELREGKVVPGDRLLGAAVRRARLAPAVRSRCATPTRSDPAGAAGRALDRLSPRPAIIGRWTRSGSSMAMPRRPRSGRS